FSGNLVRLALQESAEIYTYILLIYFVSTMPTREEKEPAQIAAGTFPRAIEVKAIEDWTVDGTRVRKSRPV
ncbi:hypothetical protein ACWD4T_43905, partial [Streptomyces umbrinus]